MQHITCQELKQKLEIDAAGFRLLNALEPARYRAKHIPGSLNLLSREDILAQLDKEERIVVYCTDCSCNKSVNLYYLLESLGYRNIYRFAGGLVEWEAMGLPLDGEMRA